MTDGKCKIHEHARVENCHQTKIKYGDYYDYDNLYLEFKIISLKNCKKSAQLSLFTSLFSLIQDFIPS